MNEPVKASARYRFRGFTSWLTTFSFLTMLVSGVAMYVTPQGMIAHWSDWTAAGLTKDEWSAVHIACSLLFFIAAVLHIYLNWTPLLSYLRGRAGKAARLWGEAVAALALTALVAIGAYFHVPPVGYLMDANDAIKQYWSQRMGRPPVPHAERMSLARLSQYVGVSADAMVDSLREEGYDVADAKTTVDELARQKGVSAAAVFADLTTHHPELKQPRGRGMGRGQGHGPGRGRGGAGGGGGGRGGGRAAGPRAE
jgi:uncharacterized membrane protein YgcG